MIRMKKAADPRFYMRFRGSVLFYGGRESPKAANALLVRKFPKAMKIGRVQSASMGESEETERKSGTFGRGENEKEKRRFHTPAGHSGRPRPPAFFSLRYRRGTSPSFISAWQMPSSSLLSVTFGNLSLSACGALPIRYGMPTASSIATSL